MEKNKLENLIERGNIIFNNKYDYSLFKYINNKTKGIIICPIHGKFEKRPDVHLIQKQGCPRCSKVNNYEDFLVKSNKIHKNSYEYEEFIWKSSKTYINIYCKNHKGFFNMRINDHLNGTGCSICNRNVLTNNIFYNNIHKIHNYKYDYSKLNFRIGSDIGIIICPIHGEFKQIVTEHYNGCGCPKCVGKNKTTDEFIKESNLIHNNKYMYPVDYISSSIKIKIICPIHSEFRQTPNKHLSGQGCPKCKESKGEKQITKILNEKNIQYETQKTFEGCKYKGLLKFDFYLPNINTCIEFDGEQHFRNFKFEKTDEKLKIRQLRDKIKTDYCEDNNIRLIRIKYNDNIIEKLDFIK